MNAKGFALLLALGTTAAMAVGCDVHEGRFDGEFSAGGADPYNFPPPYRGVGALRQVAASGVFTEVGAYVKGKAVGYYSFPFSPSQVPTSNYSAPSSASWPGSVVDPLRVAGPGTDFRKSTGNPAPVPLAYSFTNPTGCNVPEGYQYDSFKEAFPQTEQWNVLTFLPDRYASFPFGALPTWSYRPVVAEVSVTAKDLPCQSVKSERTLLTAADEADVDMRRAAAEPDGTKFGDPEPDRYLAWAVIDPGAAVVRVGEEVDTFSGGKVTGTSVQKYGWFGQFIVAYIDGGPIPVEDGPPVQDKPTKRMRPQRIYYPRSQVIPTGSETPAAGALGQGYDVLQANRFEDGAAYSPVCEVWTYALSAPTEQAELPQDEAAIIAAAGSTLEPARTTQSTTAYTPAAALVPRYVFCLQAAPRP